MTLKQEHWIVGLIGLGAVAVIVFLMYESRNAQPAAASEEIPSGGSAQPPAQPYPNAPSNLNFEVGPSPVNLTYNTLPPDFSGSGVQVAPISSACGNGGCDGCGSGCDSCALTQQPVSVQKVPPQVLSAAVDNFQGYASKVTKSRQVRTAA